jgi:CHAT domain-containing protein
MVKKTILFVFVLILFWHPSFAQTLPLDLFWQGKTEQALQSSKKIMLKKTNYSKQELVSCYDFLAVYYLDQGHYEASLKFINLQFRVQHQTAFDSAFFYARTANYYHCYINPDSAYYFCLKAKLSFKRVTLNITDSNSIARYCGFLGNALRNTPYRSLTILDSAILFSKIHFTKAINHRKYATFLIDELTGYAIRKGDKKKFIRNSIRCIEHLKKAEESATQIFPNQKSDLHSRIYDIWSLAERINGNFSLSHELTQKARSSLIDHKTVFNFFEYAASLNADASNKLSQYRDKKNNINLVHEAEILLNTSVPYWEGFLKEELRFSRKNFDDRYDLNPYVKLTTVYYELYKVTKNIEYIYKIQGLSEIIKHTDITSDKRPFFNQSLNKKTVVKLQAISKKNKYAIINYVASTNPNNLMAIVSLPDTTLLLSCSENEFIKNESFGIYVTDIFTDPIKTHTAKKVLVDAYNLCFKNIDVVLQKKRIKTIHIITHGLINGINFDLALTDTSSNNSFKESNLLNKYNILYHSNASELCQYKNETPIYSSIDVLAPDYKKTSYPEIIFGKTLLGKIKSFFNVIIYADNNDESFFKRNRLIQFIGHIKSHEFSNQQYLVLNDSDAIKSNTILNYDLTGSSYLLNGCASNVGKHEMNNKVNNLPNYLMNQHATAVISTLWPIDDKENAEFLEKFYTYLSEGFSSSEALRQTKLYFAKLNYPPSMWGAYLYYGNDFYLHKKETSYFYLYMSIGLFLIVGILFIYLKKIKTQQ